MKSYNYSIKVEVTVIGNNKRNCKWCSHDCKFLRYGHCFLFQNYLNSTYQSENSILYERCTECLESQPES